MADDKHSDSYHESDESTPLPSGAELADDDPVDGHASDADAPELSDETPIDDPEDTPDDAYVDDPSTDDINEAKLDRATDEAADEPTVSPGSTAQRRPRSTRPTRRRPAGVDTADAEPTKAEPTKAELAELDAEDESAGSAVATRPGRRTPARKDRPTAPRKKAEAQAETRTTPGKFVGESVGELRKVVWPTANQVQQYFVVVLVFVMFIIAFVSLLDLAFGWALLKIFG
ncbi:hypothetical protein GCM10027418_27280 [Mariniluteicoccus endophyticus]